MALNLNNIPGGGGGNDRPLIKAGTYPGRFIGYVEMGLHPQSYLGEAKDPAQEIALTYEFSDEFMKDEDGNDLEDKPIWLSEQMAVRNLAADKAKSTKRYNVLDPAGAAGGEFPALIGTPVMITVIQNPGKGKNVDKVYNNIDAISVMRDKDAKRCPAAVNEPLVFELDNPNLVAFDRLPKWIKERITGNLEFRGSKLERMLAAANKNNKPAQQAAPKDEDEDEDEAPY